MTKISIYYLFQLLTFFLDKANNYFHINVLCLYLYTNIFKLFDLENLTLHVIQNLFKLNLKIQHVLCLKMSTVK